MEKTKVCIWLDSELHAYLNGARGEELTIPQYIRLICKQKMKSAAKRKPREAIPMDLYGFSTITSDLVPDDLKELANTLGEIGVTDNLQNILGFFNTSKKSL